MSGCRCACRSRRASVRSWPRILKSDGVKAEGLGPARIPIWNRDGDVPTAELSISSLLDRRARTTAACRRIRPAAAASSCCRSGARADEDGLRDEDSVHAGAACVSPGGDDRRRADAARLLSEAPAPRATSISGIRAALERLLVSPDFLFRIEADPAERSRQAPPYRLSDVELASRLSFFLWSSIPDDELLDLATGGKLQDARCPRAAGAAHARRPALPRGAGGQLLRPVAADAQRLAADAGRQHGNSRGSTTTCAARSCGRPSSSSTIS